MLLLPLFGARRELAVTGTVFLAMASVAAMLAAAASGFIAPGTVADLATADAPTRAMLLNSFHYTGLLNQTSGRIYALLEACGILLWSIAMLGGPTFTRGLAGYGLIFGAAVLVGVVRHAAAGRARLRGGGAGTGSVVCRRGCPGVAFMSC